MKKQIGVIRLIALTLSLVLAQLLWIVPALAESGSGSDHSGEATETQAITLLESEHGELLLTVDGDCPGSAVPTGTAVQLTAVPNEGYEAVGIFVYYTEPDGPEQLDFIPLNNNAASFDMPPFDCSFRGVFVLEGSARSFQIHLESNDDRFATTTEYTNIGSPYPVPHCDFSRINYVFCGWNTKPDGSGTAYDEGESFLPDRDGITLYAQWAEQSAWKALQENLEHNDYVSFSGPVAATENDTAIIIPAGRSVTLNLSNCVLTADALDGYAIVVEKDASLCITGRSNSGGGYVNFSNNGVGRITKVNGGIYNEGSLTLENNIIIEDVAANTYAVYNEGFFEMRNSFIFDCLGNAVYNKGTFNFCSSHIRNCAGTAIVNADTDCYLYMDSASIRYSRLGVDNNGEFEMYSAEIRHNVGGEAGGVKNSGSFTMDLSIINNNTGTIAGGILNTGTLIMGSGNISYNSGYTAGGIYSDGPVELTDCQIDKNTATGPDGAGGLYFCNDKGNSSLTLFSGVYLDGNYKSGAPSNIYLPEGVRIHFSAPEEDYFYIGVTSGAPDTVPVLTEGLSESVSQVILFSEDENYYISINEDGEAVLLPVVEEMYTVTYMLDESTVFTRLFLPEGSDLPLCYWPEKEGYVFWHWALEDGSTPDIDNPPSVSGNTVLYAVWTLENPEHSWDWLQMMLRRGGYVRMTDNVDTTYGPLSRLVVPSGVSVRLDLNGYMIDGSDLIEPVITVEPGGELTLVDSKYPAPGSDSGSVCAMYSTVPDTIVGNGQTSIVEVGGQFNMAAGNLSYGGGIAAVHVLAGGTFNMTGGSITNNTITREGGVFNEGTFNLEAGTITLNNAWNGAGGVTNRGTFNMTGGSIERDNGKAASAVANFGTFNMSYGTIQYNEYTSDAYNPSAVNNASGASFTLSGGSICENYSYASSVYNLGTFTMLSGYISDNQSLCAGAGVLQADGVFTLHGGNITNNYSDGYVGGVYVKDGEFRLSGNPVVAANRITNNTSSDLMLAEGEVISIDGPLGPGTFIGVFQPAVSTSPTTLTSGLEGNGGIEGFYSNIEDFTIKLDEATGEAVWFDALNPGDGVHIVYFFLNGNLIAWQYVEDNGFATPVGPFELWKQETPRWYWYNNGSDSTLFDFESMPITGDVDLYAYTNDLYSLQFDPNGGEGIIQPIFLAEGDEFTFPECSYTPPMGMQFSHWETGFGAYEEGDTITVYESLDVHPVWEYEAYDIAVDQDIPHGSLVLDTSTYTVADFIEVQILPNPGCRLRSLTYTTPGSTQTFDFGLDGYEEEFFTFPVYTTPGDMTITATFMVIDVNYTVDFVPIPGGEISTSVTVHSGDAVSEPTDVPEQRGKVFSGWCVEGEVEPFDFENTPVFSDLTLVGLWEDLPRYTVNLAEVVNGTVSVTAHTSVNGETVVTPVEPGVTPVYTEETIALAIEADVGYSLYEIRATDAGDIAINIVENSFAMPAGNVDLTVSFAAVGDYTVSVVKEPVRNGDGTVTAKARANGNESVPVTAKPETGCRLSALTIEYVLDGEVVVESILGANSFSMPAADVTLRAVFSDYTIDVSADGHGTVEVDQSARAGATVALTIAPDDTYILDSLSVADVNGNPVSMASDRTFLMPDADVVVNVAFRLEGMYFVTFNTDTEDLTVPIQEVWDGEYAVRPADEAMVRVGYALLGWYAAGATEPYDFENTPITSDITLTARWEKLCKVDFGGYNDGENYESQYVHAGECVTPPAHIEKDGYTMQYWYEYRHDNEPFDFSTPITRDMSFMTCWAKNITTWAELRAAGKQDAETGRVILLNDIQRPSNDNNDILIERFVHMVLNLNGHTLNVNKLSKSAIFLNNNASFTLIDPAGGGRITGASYSVGTVMSNASFTINSGVISGNTVYSSSSSTNDCGVINVLGGGSFTMNGGVIEDNHSTGFGGAVYVDGTFTMNGGIIRNNSAQSGAGVYVEDGTMNFKDGEIVSNTASSLGGGIFASIRCKFVNMTGGMISDNSAKWGGGVYACSGSSSSQSFRISNGSITGNTASEYGGGVCAEASGFGFYGKVNVTGNTLTDGSVNNLLLMNTSLATYERTKIVSIGQLDADSRIGVSFAWSPTYSCPLYVTTQLNNRAVAENFFSDDSTYEIIIDETGEARMIFPQPIFMEPDFRLPQGIRSIEESAFEGIAAESIYIPYGCTSIGEYAFKDCSSLKQIHIPDSVTTIADTAFENCKTLKAFYGGAAAEQEAESLGVYYGGDYDAPVDDQPPVNEGD